MINFLIWFFIFLFFYYFIRSLYKRELISILYLYLFIRLLDSYNKVISDGYLFFKHDLILFLIVFLFSLIRDYVIRSKGVKNQITIIK